MKELTRFELAAVKDVFKRVKNYRKKINRLQDQVDVLKGSIREAEAMIDLYEAPVKQITGGYTSEDYFRYIAEPEVKPEIEETPVESSDEGVQVQSEAEVVQPQPATPWTPEVNMGLNTNI